MNRFAWTLIVAIFDRTEKSRKIAVAAFGSFIVLAALTAVGSFASPGAPPIFRNPQFAVGSEPRDVEIADLNNDGIQDAVVPNFSDRSVSIMLGTGGGGFTQHVVLPVDGGPQAVAVADFDGDGNLDLAAAQRAPNQVTVYRGAGNGNFSHSANIAVSGRAQDIVAANLAGGPSVDLAVAITGGAEGVTLLVNDGAGGFADDGNVFDTSDRFGLAVGDLDGDGDNDIVAGAGLQVTVFRNAASGFTALSSVMIATSGTAFRLALGDLDDDGDLDLAATAFGTNEVAISTNLGDGRFAPTHVEAIGTVNVISVDMADLDGDRRAEIIAVGENNSTRPGLLAILSGDPATGFTISTQEVATLPVSVRAARIDNDARTDVAIVGGAFGGDLFLPGKLTVLLNGGFGGLGGYQVYDAADAPQAVVASDFDGNGSQDLAVANFPGTSISILLNNGFGLFSAAAPVTDQIDRPLSIAAADLDGDGDNDLVVGNHVRFLTLHRNLGGGSFAPAEILGNAGRSPQVAIADMNGDSFKDIVVAATLPRQVTILFNDGTGAFPTSSSQATTTRDSPSMTLADVDGMNGLDAILVERSDVNMMVLLNDGSGNLGPPTLVPIDPASSPVAIASADIDSDGDPDVAIADRDLDVVHIFENAAGSFTPRLRLATGEEVASVIFADLNNDGHADLVNSDRLAGTNPQASVGVRLGDGTGAFGDAQAYMAGRGAWGMVAANLTTGSSPDLAVTDSDRGSLWVLNVGGGSIPVEIDTDLDGLSDILEQNIALDFLDPDSDDDGLSDGLDPSVIGGVILEIPESLFSSPGQKMAMITQLRGAESLILMDQHEQAIGQLAIVGAHFDGCLSQKDPDASDWITDCNAQFRVRGVFEAVVTNLFSVIPAP